MSFYVVKGGTLTAVGEFADLRSAEKALVEQPPGTYDIVKVVKVGMEVAEVPSYRRVIAGTSAIQHPNARGSRRATVTD
jgi:hypothetical protein